MRAAMRKLGDRRGASILLALVFFLVCTGVGGIVLSSAVSNAGRLAHMQDEQQAYLTVSSAAKLLRDELAGVRFTGQSDSRTGSDTFPLLSGAPNSLTDRIEAAATAVYSGGTLPAPVPFTIAATEPGIDPVRVTLTMAGAGSEPYALSAVLSLEGVDTRYTLTLTVPATFRQTVTNHVEYYSTWHSDAYGELVETIHETYYTITTTTLVYGVGTIVKGGVA